MASASTLWAPWRLPYIVSPKDSKPEGCFLCSYAASPEQDAANQVILRGPLTFITINRFPYNNGHLLVSPLAHKATLEELTDAELLECSQGLRAMTTLLKKVMGPDGFNLGLNLGRVAGAGVPGHLHWHIVPRWNGDTNFMPVTGATRVIPQSLEALYELLQQGLQGN